MASRSAVKGSQTVGVIVGVSVGKRKEVGKLVALAEGDRVLGDTVGTSVGWMVGRAVGVRVKGGGITRHGSSNSCTVEGRTVGMGVGCRVWFYRVVLMNSS